MIGWLDVAWEVHNNYYYYCHSKTQAKQHVTTTPPLQHHSFFTVLARGLAVVHACIMRVNPLYCLQFTRALHKQNAHVKIHGSGVANFPGMRVKFTLRGLCNGGPRIYCRMPSTDTLINHWSCLEQIIWFQAFNLTCICLRMEWPDLNKALNDWLF